MATVNCDGTPTAVTTTLYPFRARTIANRLGLEVRPDEWVTLTVDEDNPERVSVRVHKSVTDAVQEGRP